MNSRRKFLSKSGAGLFMAGAFGGQSFGVLAGPYEQANKDKNVIWDPYQFGAKGDGKSMDTRAIQMAIDRCNEAGGGKVYLHKGCFISGTIYLKSNVTLHVEAGAILRGSDNLNDFPSTLSRYPSFTGEFVTHKMLIYAEDQQNITICGRGTIDCNGRHWIKVPRGTPSFSAKPRGIHLRGCENVQVSDITLYNAASWMMLLQSCKNRIYHWFLIN